MIGREGMPMCTAADCKCSHGRVAMLETLLETQDVLEERQRMMPPDALPKTPEATQVAFYASMGLMLAAASNLGLEAHELMRLVDGGTKAWVLVEEAIMAGVIPSPAELHQAQATAEELARHDRVLRAFVLTGGNHATPPSPGTRH